MVKLEDYNYILPPELIAQKGLKEKDQSNLLVLNNKITHHKFYEIVNYLEKGDVLVINETKVKKCKLVGKKESGRKAEVTLISGKNKIYMTRIQTKNPHQGMKIYFKNNLEGVIKEQKNDLFKIEFNRIIKKEELELLTPPYIKNSIPEKDYQTVFAKQEGSLAAPTAGLHFTKDLLNKIKKKGIKIAKVKLNISYATFFPVMDINNHNTGQEAFLVNKKNADLINSGNIVAVGTTVIKCLESCQWKEGKILPSKGVSELFIKPGHKFKAPIKKVITNFHLPKSSLLLLISAYCGQKKLMKAYKEAVKKKYRFFSLGDAMLIIK
jgi:S-adenosylmethionine:tRNA ribosyltransferase-isomerase